MERTGAEVKMRMKMRRENLSSRKMGKVIFSKFFVAPKNEELMSEDVTHHQRCYLGSENNSCHKAVIVLKLYLKASISNIILKIFHLIASVAQLYVGTEPKSKFHAIFA